MKYHLVGVAGVGMSSLAQLLLALGHAVSGSDRYHDQSNTLGILAKLQLLGVTLCPQDGSSVREGLDAVVVSTAIEKDNPDLVAACKKNIKVIHRAELLASLAKDKKCIAVTGTAGKTTVTGMIGWTLAELGLDPTVVNGGAVLNWVSERCPGNFRFGRSDIWVLELDESDRSLLRFSPEWAVVTNISKDHFELDEVRSLFAQFAGQVKNSIIGCDPLRHGDCEAHSQERRAERDVHLLRYSGGPCAPRAAIASFSGPNSIGITNPTIDFQPELTELGIGFQYQNVKFSLPVLGRHNAENALNCVMLCDCMGLDLQAVGSALKKFAGIGRRMEIIGRTKDVTVVDDYAHNPAKIAAAWEAIAPFAERIIAVWRPHGYGPLALMRRELVEVFMKKARRADRIFLLPVYFAGGTATKEVTARMLADDLLRGGLAAGYIEDYEKLRSRLLEMVRPGDVVLFMGARDPDLPLFVRRFFLDLDNFVVHRVSGPGRVAQENKPADQAESR